ncbi:MAG: HDOD domain-containing protein [Rubrivivax sp.]
MNALMLGLLALATLVVLLWLWRARAGDRPAPRPAPRPAARPEAAGASAALAAAPVTPAPAAPPRPLPPALAAFRVIGVDEWSGERRSRYITAFGEVPRPPRLLQQLLSPDFVHSASTAQLVDLINAEPLFAAKLLSAVNSPLYGLQRRVTAVDQAVMILGLETVRSVCLQYMMIASFKADTPQRQALLDTTWAASAMASEITQRLAQALQLDDRGATVSAVVLSFLGRLATVALTPAGVLGRIPARDLLARKGAEQQLLGLGATEIGRLLMIDWGLPDAVIDDACDIDQVLVCPRAQMDPRRASRLALAYLGARLGERLAHQELPDLAAFDLLSDDSAELFHLQSHLDHPTLARLPERLRDSSLHAAIARMRGDALALSPA